MDSKETGTSDAKIGGRVFFSACLIGCCLLAGGMALASLVAEERNRDAAAVETRAVHTALQTEVDGLGERLRAFATVTPPGARGDGIVSASGPFHWLFVVGRQSAVILNAPPVAEPARVALAQFLQMAPGHNGLRGGFESAVDLLPDGVSRADILQVGKDPVVAVALGARAWRSERHRDAELVAFERIDEAMLARIARTAGTGPLTLAVSDIEPLGTGVSLTSGDNDRFALTWTPATPGNRLLSVAGMTFAWVGTLYAALILFRSRRVTRELIDSEARAKSDAAHDLLTGLINRNSFQRLLSREINRVGTGGESSFAVLYLDIDRFKEINDTHGHAAGDHVIVVTAQRIMQSLRPGERVARIGGDEFAILMPSLAAPIECATLSRRILDLFADPIDIGASKAFVTLSIGIAVYPNDADNADAITSSADLALYRAKNEGRNRYCFFETRMGEELRLRRTVEDDLRRAIGGDQLVMEYQPVMALDGRKMLGVEALVRWHHPTQGVISPASFITLAEECGLILPLGEWVLRQALQQVRRWPSLRVAVNVSAIQFRQKAFVPTVQRLLDETGVDPGQLELELTESVLLADADQAEDAMIELRAMGVRLALDDFGTGYSSLIYLRRFAFDKIKIDRSFLESTEATGESAIIVHSIVHLGRALGLTVTAEGVETQDQHRFLQALGCHELQGFLFSPPLTAAEIDQKIATPAAISQMRSVA